MIIVCKLNSNLGLTISSNVSLFFAQIKNDIIMKIQRLLIVLFFTSICFSQNSGTIAGQITEKNSDNKPISNVSIIVTGTSIATTTNTQGQFKLELPAGQYVVGFSLPGYEYEEIVAAVQQGVVTTINTKLTPSNNHLKEVVVKSTSKNREKATALLLEQKNAMAIKQSIGAQEMSAKGIGNVETGLTKMTGISKVESKGLFIRGLEDRYNNLLLNGMAVPSNSPFKKMIPLDQFPTDVVGFMDVYKTFNSDIFGDFSGATIDVATAQPTEAKTKIALGAGFTTQNSLQNFLQSVDADNSKSYFGFGGQERRLPTGYGNIPSAKISNDYQSTWDVTSKKAPLNTSFGIGHSDKFLFGNSGAKLYYHVAAHLDNKYQIRQGVDRTFSQGQGIYDNNLYRTAYSTQTQSSVIFGLQFKTKRLHLFSNSLFLKTTENSIQDQKGYTRTAVQNPNEFIRLNQYESSQYFANQLFGTYKITDNDQQGIAAGISYTRTQYDMPDRKFVTGTQTGSNTIDTQYGSNNLIRQFFNIENNFHVSGKLEYYLKWGQNQHNKVNFGYSGFAEYMQSIFRFAFGKPNGTAVPFTVNPNQIEATIQHDVASNKVYFQEESSSEYKTKVFQRADGFYSTILFHLKDKLEINIGIRAENTIREYKYRTISDPITNPFRKKSVEKWYVLPAINVKYIATEKANIRFAASKTYTKPVLFESLDINLINADGTTERGNSDLINSENYNVDLKFEIFPTTKELFAATFFAKYINNPIERTIQSSATGSGQTITYFNNKNAQLFGAEFEVLIQLTRINENWKGWSFGFNTSLMFTEATVNQNRSGYFDTFEKRKLQGASTWLINSDIKYEFNIGSKWKNTASLVYAVYGERIYAVGIAGYDHIYEKPFHKLDFVWGSVINKNWNFKWSIDNILNPIYKQELGTNNQLAIAETSLLLRSYQRGIGFSTGLSFSF